MRRAALAIALVALGACKKEKEKAEVPPPAPSGSASAAAATGIGPPSPPPEWRDNFDPVPLGTEPLHLVAAAKDPNRKVISFGLYGDTIWLSTNGTDALATGDAALAKVKDPLAGVPYEPGVHDLRAVGLYPNLYVLRWRKQGPPQPAAFVFRNGQWIGTASALPDQKPIAFLAYGRSALMVTGVHDSAKRPTSYFSGEGRGTVLTVIDAEGHVSLLHEELSPKFIAWNGAWDATGISLIGAIAEVTDLSYGPHWVPVGTYIFQLRTDGKAITTKIQGKKAYDSIVPDFALYRNNGFTTSEPERFYIVADNERWRPNGATTFRVDSTGGVVLRSVESNHHNYLSRSRFVGENLYTIQGYRPSDRQADPVTLQLLRVGPNGVTLRIQLPPIKTSAGEVACEPREIIAGPKEDLWIQAACGCKGEWWLDDCPNTIPAIFRRGGPEQPPVDL